MKWLTPHPVAACGRKLTMRLNSKKPRLRSKDGSMAEPRYPPDKSVEIAVMLRAHRDQASDPPRSLAAVLAFCRHGRFFQGRGLRWTCEPFVVGGPARRQFTIPHAADDSSACRCEHEDRILAELRAQCSDLALLDPDHSRADLHVLPRRIASRRWPPAPASSLQLSLKSPLGPGVLLLGDRLPLRVVSGDHAYRAAIRVRVLTPGARYRRGFHPDHAVWCFQPHDGGRVRGPGIIHSHIGPPDAIDVVAFGTRLIVAVPRRTSGAAGTGRHPPSGSSGRRHQAR